MSKLIRTLGFVLLFMVSDAALAQQFSCQLGFGANPLAASQAYAPLGGAVQVKTQGGFSVANCTRKSGNAHTFPATFLVGATPTTGTMSDGSGHALSFGVYQDYSTCATPWGNTVPSNVIATTPTNVNTANSNTTTTPTTFSGSFCFLINAGQTNAVPGNYTASITAYVLDQAGFQWGTGTFNVSAVVNASCTLTAPANIAMSYTSFASTASTGQSAFSVTCTNTTPYTLSLDATSGTMLGLNYTLALSATSGTGTGLAQGYTVNASIAAGQSGICAAGTCNASVTRTLTLSY